MGEIKDEINFENFLDNYFDLYRPTVEKNESENGLTIKYSKEGIYVWCYLDKTKTKIKKLEFGRYSDEFDDKLTTTWIKGVFVNDEHSYTTFLQTSFFGEDGRDYEADFYKDGKEVVLPFLKTPCQTGWTEENYWIDQNNCYKVIARLVYTSWKIIIMDVGEQDLPNPLDKFDQWLRVKIWDSFWYNSRRTIKKIKVPPMSGQINLRDN